MLRLCSSTFVLALVFGIAGCADPGYRVRVAFEDGMDPADVQFIELVVLDACPADVASGAPPSGVVEARVGLSRADAEALPAIGSLGAGSYGLYARGFDGSCAAIAAGCTPIALERGGDGTLEVVLAATPSVACDLTVATCVEGECVVPENVDACVDHPCPEQFYCVDLPGPAPNNPDGRTCTPLTQCTTEQYESTPPTPTTDRLCEPCFPTCGEGEYESQACAHGNAMQNRICGPCASSCTNCDGPGAGDCTSCPPNQWDDGSTCVPVTNCGAGEYAAAEPSATSDRVCASCAAPCEASQWESRACADGNGADDRVCSPLTVCGTDEYESTAPTATTNRVCSPCTAVSRCTSAVTCTNASNSQCTSCETGYAVVHGTADTCVPDSGTCTLTASADGSVRVGALGPVSSGTATTMATTQSVGGAHYSYVKFDIAGCAIPAGATIDGVTLSLWLSTTCGCINPAHELNRITSAWTESTVGAGTQPTTSGTSASFNVPLPGESVTIAGTGLTSDLQGFVDGTLTNHGWRVLQTLGSGNAGTPFVWSTREASDAAVRPRLVIEWSL